jgi:hypothetical protein
MATKIVKLCDMTGAEIQEGTAPVILKLVNGTESFNVSLDLSDEAKGKLLKALMPYAKAGRDAGPVIVPAKSNGSNKAANDETQAIRAWAMTQPQFAVKDRGRIPEAVVAAYRAAHPEGEKATAETPTQGE